MNRLDYLDAQPLLRANAARALIATRKSLFAIRDHRATGRERDECQPDPPEIQKGDSWGREPEFRLPARKTGEKYACKPLSFLKRAVCAPDRPERAKGKIPGDPCNMQQRLRALRASPCCPVDRSMRADSKAQ